MDLLKDRYSNLTKVFATNWNLRRFISLVAEIFLEKEHSMTEFGARNLIW